MTAPAIASTIFARQALLPTGWARDVAVTLQGDRIASVTPGSTGGRHAVEVGCLVPAPVNLHSHAFQRAMAGLTERRGPDPADSFWTWRRLMYRFLEQLTPEDVEAITAFVQMQMLEAGYAGVCEFHYLHHAPGGRPYAHLAEMSERIVAAADRTGIGLTLLPVLYQQGGCDGRPLVSGQDRFGNDPDRFARLVEQAGQALRRLPADARLGTAPHSLRAVSPQGLAASLAASAALVPDGPVHIHAAEQVGEVTEVEAHLGLRPVRWLLDKAGVDHRWCLIHCTQMLPDEVRDLAASGAVAGLCPITESSLGDGIFEAVAYRAAGGRFGIGSDSNIRISLAEELRTLEHSQRLRDRRRALLASATWSTGRSLIEAVCGGGAQAAGRESGAIAAGRLADLTAFDDSAIDLSGREGDILLDAFIFAAPDTVVRDVWSAGRHVVASGHHRAHDTITAAYRATLARLAVL